MVLEIRTVIQCPDNLKKLGKINQVLEEFNREIKEIENVSIMEQKIQVLSRRDK